jgi:hypothetical protein
MSFKYVLTVSLSGLLAGCISAPEADFPALSDRAPASVTACEGNSSSAWNNCVAIGFNSPPNDNDPNHRSISGIEVVLDKSDIPGAISATDNKNQQIERIEELGIDFYVVDNKVFAKFDDGSPDFPIGTMVGSPSYDGSASSYSQELVLAPGVSAANTSVNKGVLPENRYFTDAVGICIAYSEQEIDNTMAVKGPQRTLAMTSRSIFPTGQEWPSPGRCN